jgi:hypothetical protein
MVGGSQGVCKGLIYSGFNILLFFFAYAKGFRGRAGVFETVLGNFFFSFMCVTLLEILGFAIVICN